MRTLVAHSVLVLSFSLLTLGCDAQSQSSRYSYGNIGWNTSTEDAVAGIDQAMICWYTRDDDLVYVTWTDLSGGNGTSSGSGGNSNRDREQHETTVDLSDGSQFRFKYLRDLKEKGATGVLTIDNLNFDTRLGKLLVVSTKDGATDVHQLEIPASLAKILKAEDHTPESLRNNLQELVRQKNELNAYFGNK